MTTPWDTHGHPPFAALLAHVTGALSDPLAGAAAVDAQIEDHVASCDPCTALVSVIGQVDRSAFDEYMSDLIAAVELLPLERFTTRPTPMPRYAAAPEEIEDAVFELAADTLSEVVIAVEGTTGARVVTMTRDADGWHCRIEPELAGRPWLLQVVGRDIGLDPRPIGRGIVPTDGRLTIASEKAARAANRRVVWTFLPRN